MRRAYVNILMITVLVLTAMNGCNKNQKSAEYIKSVRFFADCVLEDGRDDYGKKTPLFVDGLHVETLEPVKWMARGGEPWIISNFASQQSLMRLLDGLTVLTGDEKYRQAAEAAAGYALEHLRAENGLLYWGGHMAWDLSKERPMGHIPSKPIHELKYHQPYFELMWRVDSLATIELMEMIWAGHVLNWSTLHHNRHASFSELYVPGWDQWFDENADVPLSAIKKVRSFSNVTPPLLRAGILLGVLDGHDDALLWSYRLLYRWQQARHPLTGLSGSELGHGATDRAQIALGHIHPDINEAKITKSMRYHSIPLAQMQAAEMLKTGDTKYMEFANEMIAWASDDLKSYFRECYDANNGVFAVKMINGDTIQWRKAKTGYYTPQSFAPKKPGSRLYWGYAMAYRLTNDTEHWAILRELGKQMGIGDMGTPDGHERSLVSTTDSHNWEMIYALLELERSTGDRSFLDLACLIADNIIDLQTEAGLYPNIGKEYARTGDQKPLAVLHLAAALQGKGDVLPQPVFDNAFYHAVYHGDLKGEQEKRADKRTVDNLVFY